LDGIPVIVNLEETAEEKIKQIIDFISGTAVAASCRSEQIGQKIFVFTPQNIDLETNV
jgi:FtsZ-interacting cell division protein YlmF